MVRPLRKNVRGKNAKISTPWTYYNVEKEGKVYTIDENKVVRPCKKNANIY